MQYSLETKIEKLKTKALIDDIIIEYSNTADFIQQKLNGKCDREGIPTDKVHFFNKSRRKPSMLHFKVSICY